MQKNKEKKVEVDIMEIKTVINSTKEERKNLFNSIMENIKPLEVDENGKVITASARIPLSLLFLDERYQRKHKESSVRRLYKNWDVRKLAPILVAPHYDDYVFSLIDGNNRTTVMEMRNIPSATATIMMQAPTDDAERLKFECEIFADQDSESEKVKLVEKHNSNVIRGDKAATIIQKLVEEYNVAFVETKGQRNSAILGSYSDTYSIAKTENGDKILEFIFSIIQNAGWHDETNGYATYIFRALKSVWIAHPENREDIHKFLSTELRQYDPELFGASARAKYPKRDYRSACVLYAEDLVCDGMHIDRKIYKDGEKRYLISK